MIRVVPCEWEALHDNTGGDRWSLSLAFAAKSEEWQVLPKQWLEDLILKGATEARSMADWVSSSTGVTIPSRRITAEEYRAGEPGFISYAELNPGHTSGPGDQFPWEAFLNEFKKASF